MHIASRVDLDESFEIGRCAVKTSINGQTGVTMIFNRTNQSPYTIECDYKNVSDIANLEQRIPVEWINKEHNDITQELYDYLNPLIQGEVALTYENGIPQYIDIEHLKQD